MNIEEHVRSFAIRFLRRTSRFTVAFWLVLLALQTGTRAAAETKLEAFADKVSGPIKVAAIAPPPDFIRQLREKLAEAGYEASPTWSSLQQANVRVIFLDDAGADEIGSLGVIERSAFQQTSQNEQTIVSRVDGSVTVDEARFTAMIVFVYVSRFNMGDDELTCTVSEGIVGHFRGEDIAYTSSIPAPGCEAS